MPIHALIPRGNSSSIHPFILQMTVAVIGKRCGDNCRYLPSHHLRSPSLGTRLSVVISLTFVTHSHAFSTTCASPKTSWRTAASHAGLDGTTHIHHFVDYLEYSFTQTSRHTRTTPRQCLTMSLDKIDELWGGAFGGMSPAFYEAKTSWRVRRTNGKMDGE